MSVFCSRGFSLLLFVVVSAAGVRAQSPGPSSSSSRKAHASQTTPKVAHTASSIDAGSVSNGVYKNKALGLTCKIPAGWVLRTDEMNAREEDAESDGGPTEQKSRAALDRTAEGGCPHMECGKVLLAAFSRPPEARAEDVNSSIVIAAEPVAVYPGLKVAAQYFGPLTEVAKAQGFSVVEEPYEFTVGTKTLPRGDFQKDVGSRVMRQSTLAMLAHGYAVSFTVIGGTEDEVEELVGNLEFRPQPARR